MAESARNKLNQIYWRIKANNSINYPYLDKKYAWIKSDDYDESIKKVIGKAIGDCVTCEEEFAGKKAGDLIVFDGTDPLGYEQMHWNAVMLYNYVFHMLYSEKDIQRANRAAILGALSQQLAQHYLQQISEGPNKLVDDELLAAENKIGQGLAKAITDIDAYAEALDMEYVLDYIQDASLRFNENGTTEAWAPRVWCNPKNNIEFEFITGSNLMYRFNNGILEPKNEKRLWNHLPSFQLIDNNWYIVKMAVQRGYSIDNDERWCKDGYSDTADRQLIEGNCLHALKLLDGLAKLYEYPK